MIIDRFLQWVTTAPTARRAEAAGALARAYLHSEMDEIELEGVEAALTVLMDDVSPLVRGAVAEALATSHAAPRHLVLTLAADQVDVARPILERSPLLDDGDLVDLVAIADEPAQVAICRRPDLSPAVAAAATEVVSAGAALALIDAHGATLPLFILRRLAARFAGEADIRAVLLRLDRLPVDARQMLVEHLSAALGSLAAERAWLGVARAERITREACDRATLAIADGRAGEVALLVRHLRATGRLTAALLLRSVLATGLDFFQAAIAELAAMPAERVASILAERRSGPFRALCHRAGLPSRVVPVFRAALAARQIYAGDDVRLGRYRFVRQLGEYVLKAIDGADGDIDDLRALVRRILAEATREAARDYTTEAVAA